MRSPRIDSLELWDLAEDRKSIAIREHDVNPSFRDPSAVYYTLGHTIQNILGKRIEEEGYPIALRKVELKCIGVERGDFGARQMLSWVISDIVASLPM